MHNVYLLAAFLIYAVKLIDSEWWDVEEEQAKLFFDDGPARIRDYPHIVSVAVQLDKDTASLLCTGTYLTTYDRYPVILTTGSCVKSILEKVDDISKIYVRTNSEYWNCQCGIGRTYAIYATLIHPEYTEHVLPFVGAFSENDVGLIALNSVWEGVYNKLAAKYPVQLASQESWSIKRVLTLGWGYSEKSSSASAELRKAENLLILSPEACKKFYTEYFPKNSYCVGSEQQPGKGPCSHDQGAPMLTATKVKVESEESQTVDIKFYLMGIASTAPRCGDPRKPVIVVNITQYAPFIQNLTWIGATAKESYESELFSSVEALTEWQCQSTDEKPKQFMCCKKMLKLLICFGWQPEPDGKIWFYGELQFSREKKVPRKKEKPNITGISCRKIGGRNMSKCCVTDSYICFKWQQHSERTGIIWWSFPGSYSSWWSRLDSGDNDNDDGPGNGRKINYLKH
ncbi:hypothetical protein ILUMI_02080 [Ignelater luminosus]|uniref:Peptidase S1 domain-containing protein n=1 Tax=Ignelater luminosus TaxID=2038154 RepID=A0A8K0GGT2_IGNLU|nr:hypothetical protein ILUMI_02080 [Ignelater luminosus]